MHAYRFILRFEDYSDFSREVDVLADHTFEHLYNVIAENLKLDKKQWSAFYICDHNFRKKKEILKELPENSANIENQEAPHANVIMPEANLNDYINDPHQRMMFAYDETNQWTFYIEMLKVFPADDNKEYPLVIKMEGETPRELTPVKIPLGDGEHDEDDETGHEDDGDFDDSTFYNNDDISDMETEKIGGDTEKPDFSEDEPPEDFDEE